MKKNIIRKRLKKAQKPHILIIKYPPFLNKNFLKKGIVYLKHKKR